jgi:thiamine-phosphate pyrophosphorylase
VIVIPMVHAVTDDRVVALPDFLDRARALAVGPEIAIHLRARLSGSRLLSLADALGDITASGGARLIIHDRADVARLCRADGVHLPKSGIPVERARALIGQDALLGRSVHTPAEAQPAMAAGADYVFLGNIWETPSHHGRPGLGVRAITEARVRGVIAIGGVTAERAALAADAGAVGVAAIRALWDAADPAAAVRTLRVSFLQ